MPRSPAEPDSEAGRGLEALDRLLGHRARLGICVLLSRYDEISFTRFKEVLQETDGSLGAHLRKLEDEGYVTVRKEFQDRKPISWYELTAKGKRAVLSHVNALRHVIRRVGENKPPSDRASLP